MHNGPQEAMAVPSPTKEQGRARKFWFSDFRDFCFFCRFCGRPCPDQAMPYVSVSFRVFTKFREFYEIPSISEPFLLRFFSFWGLVLRVFLHFLNICGNDIFSLTPSNDFRLFPLIFTFSSDSLEFDDFVGGRFFAFFGDFQIFWAGHFCNIFLRFLCHF